jgi:hypothetical protein
MTDDKRIERGAASMFIELRDGDITINHGSDNTLLAHLDDAPEGTWGKLWAYFEALGFCRDCHE